MLLSERKVKTLLELLRERGWQPGHSRMMFVGGTDSGKTTLARSLALFVAKKGFDVLLVDLDCGQASIFLPATVSWGRAVVGRFPKIRMLGAAFVGDINPSRCQAKYVSAASVAFAETIRLHPDMIVVDTPGYVEGFGEILMTVLWEMLKPDTVILVEREGDDLSKYAKRFSVLSRIVELEADPTVRKRSREERIAYRSRRFTRYFGNAREVRFDMEKTAILGFEPEVGKLCGLYGPRLALVGLGKIEEIDEGEKHIKILTPVSDEKRVVAIEVGRMTLGKAGICAHHEKEQKQPGDSAQSSQ